MSSSLTSLQMLSSQTRWTFISLLLLLHCSIHHICVHGFSVSGSITHKQYTSSSSVSTSPTELFCKADQTDDNWAGFNQEWAGYPISNLDNARNSMKTAAAAVATTTIGLGNTKRALATENGIDSTTFTTAAVMQEKGAIPAFNEAYTDLAGMKISRILNGMWQVSGAHGYDPNKEKAVAEMAHYADEGYITFDLADIYGPAEDYVGAFKKGNLASSSANECQFFTKWVPSPGTISRKQTEEAIARSLRRMKTEQLDLLQFHWWDYENKNYYDAINHLMALQQNGQIRNIGLTNFDTDHMVDLMDEGAPIVSNQVSFSVLDTRPLKKLVPASVDRNVKLLCYGTLLGGFLSSNWLGKSEPDYDSLSNVSLRKYLPWIKYWGGGDNSWQMFQELLSTLDKIGKKYDTSVSNVALRWVLDQPAVAGVIVGTRLGYKQHIKDNSKVFQFKLDKDDLQDIATVQAKGRNLYEVLGDTGGEYRRRRRV